MDAFKLLLASKKEAFQKQGSIVRQADIEKEREEKYKQEQAELEKKRSERKQQFLDDIASAQNPYKKAKKEEFNNPSSEESQKKDEEAPSMPKEEVVKKLRLMGVPVTFFGETDAQRFKRFRKLEVDAELTKSSGGNTFDKVLKMNDDDFKKKQLAEGNDIDEEKIKKLFARLNEPEFAPPLDEAERKLQQNAKKSAKRQQELEVEKVRAISSDKKQDDILVWSMKTLRDWEEKLDKRFKTEEERKTYQARKLIGSFRQTTEYVKPLLKLLRERKCSSEILNGLYIIIHYSLQREYLKAHDKYLELAIGNAPWPMGVTMVGIHERAGRSKIFSSQVAHILNDETTRKYLQSMKRLITIQQLLYPSEDKAKMINFDATWEELF